MIRLYKIILLYCIIFMLPASAQLKYKADSLHKSFENPFNQNRISSGGISSLKKINSSTLLDSTLVQEWDNNQWLYRQLFNYSYSSDLKEKKELLRKFENNAWVNVIRTSSEYNDNHDLIWEQVELFLNNKWEYIQQKFITYTQFVGLTEELYQVWNNGWENRTRYTATYDDNNVQTELLLEDWNGAWVNSYRYLFTYDEVNKTDKVIEQYWDAGWKNMKQNITNYNESKTLTLYTYYEWINEDWQPVDQIMSTFNDKQELLELIILKWRNAEWEKSNKETHIYNSTSGLRDSVIFQSWNVNDTTWQNEAKDHYIYSNSAVKEIIFYHWVDAQWVNSFRNVFDDQDIVKSQTSQYWLNGQWVNQRMETDYYKLIVSVDQSKENLLSYHLGQNYPNPFNPISNFGFRIAESGRVEVKVYDITGREVAVLMNEEKSPGEYTLRFDSGSLASGVYFYTLKAGSFQSTKKNDTTEIRL